MTYAAMVRRGRNVLLLCLGIVLLGMVVSDLQWRGLFGSQTQMASRYLLLFGLGLVALRGHAWARLLLAGLLTGSAAYGLVLVVQIGTLLPGLAAWLVAHATLNAFVAGVLLLSPDIARYESSKNRFLLT